MAILQRKISTLMTISSLFLLDGCASFSADIEGIDYPRDTAILIGDFAYRINTIKCAQVKAVGENGVLDCYDSEGRQSASISPASDLNRKYLKENMGMEWASPEHQAYLFDFYHRGGKEKMVGGFINSVQQVAALRNFSDSLEKSRTINLTSAKMKIKGVEAYMSGGMSAWQVHQFNASQWHLNNSRYFIDQMNKSNPMGFD